MTSNENPSLLGHDAVSLGKELPAFKGVCHISGSVYVCMYIYMYTHTELSLQRANNHLPVDIASCSKLVGTSLTPLP